MENQALSPNFWLSEMIESQTATSHGIDNTPTEEQVENLRSLCFNVLQPARDAMGAIWVSSGFRCEELNTRIGGSKTSQHKEGEAADISSADNARLFGYMRNNVQFDQLIWEFGNDAQPQWIHVSYKPFGKNRGQVLKAIKKDGKTKYVPF